MFHHVKELAYTVRVDKPNPVFGRMLQQAIGGPEGEYKQYAYTFFGHGEEPMDPNARWLTGPSLDGKGEFSFADPAPRLGQEAEAAAAPDSAHDGLDATRGAGPGDGGGVIGKVKDAIAGN